MLEWVELDLEKELAKYRDEVIPDNEEFDRYRYQFLTYFATFQSRAKEFRELQERFKTASDQEKEALKHKIIPGHDFKVRKGIGTNFHFAPQPMAVLFRFDLTDDPVFLRKKLDEFSAEIVEHVKQEKEKRQHSMDTEAIVLTDYVRKKGGKVKNPEELFDLWDKCLEIYDLYEEHGNKSEVSRQMGMFNREKRKCIDTITAYLKFTQRLIDSTMNGTFLTVAAIPFSEGKPRKPKEKKKKT